MYRTQATNTVLYCSVRTKVDSESGGWDCVILSSCRIRYIGWLHLHQRAHERDDGIEQESEMAMRKEASRKPLLAPILIVSDAEAAVAINVTELEAAAIVLRECHQLLEIRE